MFPGRYPSPTPFRELAPIDRIETSPVDSVHAITPDRPSLRTYTGPDFMRQHPKFAASQSEPSLPLEHENIASPPSSSVHSYPPAGKGRRVSDPFRTPLRIKKQRDGNANWRQNLSRRAISGPANPTFPHGAAAFHPYSADQPIERGSSTSTAASTPALSTASTPATLSSSSSSSSSSHHSPPPSVPPSPSPPTTPPSNTQPKSFTSAHSINDEIYAKLRDDLTPKDGAGVIYILRDTARPDRGYKIGFTQKAPYKERLRQHWRGCGFIPDDVWVTDEIAYCKRTEKLIHLDLLDRLQIIECEGHKGQNALNAWTKHKEWFKVTEDEAKQTVKRWVAFMEEQKPYDTWRKLSPFSQYLLAARRIAQPFTRSESIHNARREQWAQVLSSPTQLEQLYYKLFKLCQHSQAMTTFICHIWSSCTKFFWQTMTLISWFVTLIALQNTFAATAFAIVLVCAWFSIMPNRLADAPAAKHQSPSNSRSKSRD